MSVNAGDFDALSGLVKECSKRATVDLTRRKVADTLALVLRLTLPVDARPEGPAPLEAILPDVQHYLLQGGGSSSAELRGVATDAENLAGKPQDERVTVRDLETLVAALMYLASVQQTRELTRGYLQLSNVVSTAEERLVEQNAPSAVDNPDPSRPRIKITAGSLATENTLDPWLKSNLRDARPSDGSQENRPRVLLTPIIGPGVLQVHSEEDQLPLDVGVRQAADAQGWRQFLETLVTYKRDGRAYTYVDSPEEADWQGLTFARVAVLRLADTANRVYQTALSRQACPLPGWGREPFIVHTPIESNGEPASPHNEMEELQKAIGAAARSFQSTFAGVDDEARMRLGARAIAHRLSQWQAEFTSAPTLTVEEVEWALDLAWHCLIFNCPTYPRASELSFQVSLMHESGSGHDSMLHPPRRRLHPGREVPPDRRLSEVGACAALAVRRGFVPDAGCSETQPTTRHGRRALLDALAESAHAEFARWNRFGRSDPVPVVVTTNLDVEVERALATSGNGVFHVAIPIALRLDGTSVPIDDLAGDTGDVRWIVAKFVIAREAREPEVGLDSVVHQHMVGKWQWLQSLELKDLGGPLVLKINGSPLHQWKPEDLAKPGASAPQGFHAVALAEFDNVQFMHLDLTTAAYGPTGIRQKDRSPDAPGLPLWVFDSLKDETRQWLILGYRMADWNLRFQLFLYATHFGTSKNRFAAISSVFEEDRKALLLAWGIDAVTGELGDLVPRLRNRSAVLLERYT